MSAVLLLSLIISTIFVSNIRVYGSKDSIKLQLHHEDTPPSVIMGKFQKSKNHQESEIKYDHKHNVIYIMTYQKSEDGSINDSALYSSSLTDLSFINIELKYQNREFYFAKIEAGPEIIVGISEIRNLLAISTDFGKEWKVTFVKLGGVKEIVISPYNSYHIAIVNILNRVFLIKDLGEEINFQTHHGIQLTCVAISLIKAKNGLRFPSTVLWGAIAFGEIGNIIWAVTE
ncbi:hypothetical protein HZS_8183, partial [Henneguya salminicola]